MNEIWNKIVGVKCEMENQSIKGTTKCSQIDKAHDRITINLPISYTPS